MKKLLRKRGGEIKKEKKALKQKSGTLGAKRRKALGVKKKGDIESGMWGCNQKSTEL